MPATADKGRVEGGVLSPVIIVHLKRDFELYQYPIVLNFALCCIRSEVGEAVLWLLPLARESTPS